MATLAQPQPTVAVPGESEPLNVVESPISPSSAFALSRFEFETDTKGNQGTKILMVEWDAAGAAVTAGSSITSVVENGGESEKGKPAKDDLSDWEVSWEGKDAATVLPIRDSDVKDATRRVYFLLPPGASIPTIVNISKKSGLVELRTKPMPAIFPEGLVSEEKGTRGVLHTLWAKKRLQELETEIADEMKDNGEGIGLEMALQERQWIVDHFGLSFDMSSAEAIPLPPNPGSPASPRSPIGGRLGEKLKGLKLATSPAEMAAAKEATKKPAQRQITAFTPDSGDVAVSSFASFQNTTSGGGVVSLNAVMETGASTAHKEEKVDTEEDLFALPMSPRSPEMAKSPFSMLKS